MIERYFDNAATTPLDPRVREAMLPYLGDGFGNANSIHAWGLRAHDAVEYARRQVADLIGAEDPSQIYFTSGATESNNWVLNAANEIVISPFEHSSMREPAIRRGARIMGNDGLELSDAKWKPGLLSVMSVNNEIGAMWNVLDYTAPGYYVHSDITQAVGKIPITVEGLDYASFSAHKFYGPKGIGALYCRDQAPEPLLLGGEQENGARGGTLNVAAIFGMGVAAEIAQESLKEEFEHATLLRSIFLDGLNGLSDTRINGGDRTSPYILSVSFQGLEGETLVLELDRAGYGISAGAACSSRSMEPSHVLTALNLDAAWLRGTVRVSFGKFNTEESTRILAEKMRTLVENLRTD